MAIEPIERRIEGMTEQLVTSTAPGIEVSYMETIPDTPVEELQGGEQVAALGSVRSLTRGLKGKRAPAQPNIVDPVPEQTVTPSANPNVTKERKEPTLDGEPSVVIPPPATEERMLDQAADRAQMIKTDQTLVAPSPTQKQLAAGVEQSPISTVAFDSTEMQATVRSASEAVLTQAPSMTVRELFERSIEIGVPESVATTIFKGMPLNSNIGDNQLAINTAGLLKLHDDSAAKMDDLFGKLLENKLDIQGQLELRQQMAFHDVVMKQVQGVQTDIARAMNTFKRYATPSEKLNPTEIREILEQSGGDDSLLSLANDYMKLTTRKGKNDLIQAGLGARTRDAWMYVYQSNLLTNPETHAYNLVSSVVFGGLAPVERFVAVGTGIARKKLNLYSGDRYYGEQTLAEMHGFFEGLLDGFEFAAHALKTGEKATYKGDAKFNPITAERLSGVPVRTGNIAALGADIATSVMAGMPMPVSPILGGLADSGRVLFTMPEMTGTWYGKLVNSVGFLHSVPFRAVAAVDEAVGGVVTRTNLYSEGWLLSNRAYNEAIAKGATDIEANEVAQQVFADLLVNRPKNIQMNIETARKQVTLMDSFNKESRVSAFFLKTDQFFNHPLAKVHIPFSKTLLNLYSEGAARIPLLNFTSPRFVDDWNKGGKHRDLAISRLMVGTSMVALGTYLSMQNRVTGSGPPDQADLQILESLGYQKYSLIFRPGEISEDRQKTLSQFAQVTQGTGSLEGHVFVSFSRIDPLAQIFATGANIGDALKFHQGKPDDPMMLEVFQAGVFGSAEYISDHPIATQIGELLKTLRTRQEDGGEKVVQVFSRFAKQYMDYSFTGTPVVGFANSSFVAKLETLSDPTRRSTMADQMNVPHGIRQMQEIRQRVLSRNPYTSKNVPFERDALGNIREDTTVGLDKWWNWSPVLRVKMGENKPTYEVLAEINHGPSLPSKVWEGVALSATQYERFKELYGVEIKLDLGVTKPDGTSYGPLNLNQAIPVALDEYVRDAAMSGEVVMLGDKQKFVDALVSKYRKMAKIKMMGFDNEGANEADLMAFMEDIGMPGSNVEFPDLARAVQKNIDIVRSRGR